MGGLGEGGDVVGVLRRPRPSKRFIYPIQIVNILQR